MSNTIPRILGQNKPDPLVDTTLFTVTDGHQAQFTVFVANQNNIIDNFSLALVPNGQVEQNASFIAYNTAIVANGVLAFSGLFLNSGDHVQVSSVSGNCSFTATGIEVIP
jgi:hypothetical protein